MDTAFGHDRKQPNGYARYWRFTAVAEDGFVGAALRISVALISSSHVELQKNLTSIADINDFLCHND